MLHTSSHPRRQQQRGTRSVSTTTNSVDTDDVNIDDADEMGALQRKVLYALSSALRGNVDVQVAIALPHHLISPNLSVPRGHAVDFDPPS